MIYHKIQGKCDNNPLTFVKLSCICSKNSHKGICTFSKHVEGPKDKTCNGISLVNFPLLLICCAELLNMVSITKFQYKH